MPGGKLAFATWDDALSALAAIRRGDGPAAESKDVELIDLDRLYHGD